MICYKLSPNDFDSLNIKCNIIKITKKKFNKYKNIIEKLIFYFNDEIRWDKMFNILDVFNRLNNNNVMYILVNDDIFYGYVWFKDYKDGRLLFNLFIRNKNIIKKYKGKEFVSDIIDRFEKNKVIYCEVDEWNKKSINLFKRLGFKQY